MTAWDLVLLVVAGIGGGLAGSIAGLASVSTYPALLLVGLPPVPANIANTVALVFNAVGSVWGSVPELRGRRRQLVQLVPIGIAGGAAGAALLLTVPSDGFERAVPILLAVSAVVIALPHRTTSDADVASGPWRLALRGALVFAICVYGGFFGAAAGVLMLAMFLRTGSATLAHANATKNVVLGVANAVAAVVFIASSPIVWSAVWPLAIGCLIGSRLGPVIVRHAPATPMRLLVAVAALALAVKLGLDAYR